MGSNKEIPGAISIRRASAKIGYGESTIIREIGKIEPPIKTIGNHIVIDELERLQSELEILTGRKPARILDSQEA